jgi:hypothetical protein
MFSPGISVSGERNIMGNAITLDMTTRQSKRLEMERR